MSRQRRLLLVIALWGCAHAPAARVSVIADPPLALWPSPPASALVGYVGTFPDSRIPPPEKPLWNRIVDAFMGFDEGHKRDRPLLARPFGLAAKGNVLFIADPDARQVLRVTWRTQEVTPIVCEDQPWTMPMAVAVDADDTLWVADGTAGVLVKVLPKGKCVFVGKGVLERPTGVVLTRGRVYTVDPPRHAIVGFTPDGREVVRFGGRGDGDRQFNFPSALALDTAGNLLVADALNFRVSRFTPDGAFVNAFGEAGDGSGAFGRPKAIAAAPDGRIFVSDAQNDVVIVFDSQDQYVVAFGGTGSAPGSLILPAGVAIAGRFLFVADSQDHRIQIYELLGETS